MTFKFYIFLAFLFLVPVFGIESAPKQDDTSSVAAPIIKISPKELVAERSPEDEFFVGEIKVFNFGEAPLKIESVTGSCSCSTAKIYADAVFPMEVGKIELSINYKGLYEGTEYVEFMIESNAENSPTKYLVKVVKRE